MNIDSFLLSEYATITDGAALTIVRSFNKIQAPGTPVRIPLMSISLVIHAHEAEAGSEHHIEVRLLNQRREAVRTLIDDSFTLPPGPVPPGMPLRHVLVRQILAPSFDEFGAYATEAYIDGVYHGGAAFFIEQRASAHGE